MSFDELYERYCDGVLNEAERREFLGLLEEPANRSRLVDVASYEAGVSEELKLARTEMLGETKAPVTNPLGFPNQHYNSLTTWAIDSKGEIKHVYV